MGTPDFSVPILQKLIEAKYEVVLVVTQPDRPKGRRRTLTPTPVKKEALKHGIPVFQPEKLAKEYEEIITYKPDLIITAAYGQLLPNELLESPNYGSINVHASLLPELRGGAPIHYAIMQGKKETGVTIMYMVEKLDAGDILSQQKVIIDTTDHVGTLHDKLSVVGSELLLQTLPQLFQGELTPEKQDDSKATFAANISREQEKIDWAMDHTDVYNHIRGLRPWPVAFTLYDGKRMKIWWSEKDDTEYDGLPGEIVQITDHESFVVVCGNGKGVRITEIQPSGKTKLTVAEYLRGSTERIKLGTIMGD